MVKRYFLYKLIKLVIFIIQLLISAMVFHSCTVVHEEYSDSSNGYDLTAVVESDTPESASPQSSDNRKQWIETVKYGNTEVTREYLDGENDYIVTEITYRNDSVWEKNVTHYKMRSVVWSEETRYDSTGEPERIYTVSEDEEGKSFVTQWIALDEIQRKNTIIIINDEVCEEQYEFSDYNGRIIATGGKTQENENSENRTVEYLDVFDSNGDLEHKERIVYYQDGTNYAEYIDKNENMVWSREYTTNLITDTYYMGNGGKVIIVDQKNYSFYDSNGDWIADGEYDYSTSIISITSFGSKYDQDALIERLTIFQELLRADWNSKMLLRKRTS